ncbi:hypothetical protein BG015_000134 [Linnemannia schmuckeri]|uniref:FAD-binding domain-containing protein n=1 Tax=Linnemannia schmuckeri TaxID=64567 RepID=A0A9P5RRK5_9FUNG|nr:hypothetical protein BG015_000134 [Linnemannia schmuckeri]
MSNSNNTQVKPTVVIVGAGLGGIMLGALLEKCSVPYVILERASTVKPLGAAISVGCGLVPAFQQLSIFDRLESLANRSLHSLILREPKELLLTLDYTAIEGFGGHQPFILSRHLLYDLLLNLIPSQKIHFNKRVQTISEKNNRVFVNSTDESVYEGDILVGADGAYSTVRQQLYERLKLEGNLPVSDEEDLPFSCTCLVGETKPLDATQFPELNNVDQPFATTLGKDLPYSWVLFTTTRGTISYMVVEHLSSKISRAAEDLKSRNGENSEWGPNVAQAMCDLTRDFPIPFGAGDFTLGDLYEQTPKELISKVSLEEKVFETWFAGRTVLLGDACHKFLPAAGQGALTSMHDAIALANQIYALPSSTNEAIEVSFKEYQDERMPPAIDACNSSKAMAKGMERGIGGWIAFQVSKYMSLWMWNNFVLKPGCIHRPQIGFLEQVKIKGSVVPAVSPSCEKAREIFEKRAGTVLV